MEPSHYVYWQKFNVSLLIFMSHSSRGYVCRIHGNVKIWPQHTVSEAMNCNTDTDLSLKQGTKGMFKCFLYEWDDWDWCKTCCTCCKSSQ